MMRNRRVHFIAALALAIVPLLSVGTSSVFAGSNGQQIAIYSDDQPNINPCNDARDWDWVQFAGVNQYGNYVTPVVFYPHDGISWPTYQPSELTSWYGGLWWVGQVSMQFHTSIGVCITYINVPQNQSGDYVFANMS
jgi:hypothetical protein